MNSVFSFLVSAVCVHKPPGTCGVPDEPVLRVAKVGITYRMLRLVQIFLFLPANIHPRVAAAN